MDAEIDTSPWPWDSWKALEIHCVANAECHAVGLRFILADGDAMRFPMSIDEASVVARAILEHAADCPSNRQESPPDHDPVEEWTC